MPGASISRWTMSYFAVALVFLVIGQALLAAGFGYPVLAIEAPETLVVIHVLALGWLALLFCGALLQFVPVLVSKLLFLPNLAPVALVLLASGLTCLICGFLSLAGHAQHGLDLLPLGGMLLTAGFGCILLMIGGTLLSGRPLGLSAKFVAIGLVSLTATALLGLTFTLELSGLASTPLLDRLFLNAPPLHAFLGLVGWMSVSAFGVGYRLLTMFLLAPETERRTSLVAWLLAGAAIAAAIAASVWGWDAAGALPWIIAVAVLAALVFVADVVAIFRQRRRKGLELNTRMSAVAVLFLMLAVSLSAVLIVAGRLEAQIGALVYLVVFGWLSVLGLGQLYKIVAFITWLEVYGPVLGRRPVPRVQDLVVERRASVPFHLYAACVGIATIALLFGAVPLFRAAAAVQALATVALVVEFVRMRRLSDVPAELAVHNGVPLRPPLFLPLASKGNEHALQVQDVGRPADPRLGR